jgi:DNA-binding beta-propeller fold protein YncE
VAVQTRRLSAGNGCTRYASFGAGCVLVAHGAGRALHTPLPDDERACVIGHHLAAGLLYVIDLRTNQVVKAIPDVPGIEGVEFVPELKKVYTSNAGDNTIRGDRPETDEGHQEAASSEAGDQLKLQIARAEEGKKDNVVYRATITSL